MSLYYFMSQLPSLDGVDEGTPLPITQGEFDDLCHRFLGKKVLKDWEALTLLPDREGQSTGSALVGAWNEGERQLRLALAQVRAARANQPVDKEMGPLPLSVMQAARAAVEQSDPLEAEMFLHRYRLALLESLRPTDAFCEDAALYYGLKLKLLERIRRFDQTKGQEAYRDIYNAIMHGEGQEAVS